MKLSKLNIKKFCILPLIFLLPSLTGTACSTEAVVNSTADAFEAVGDGMGILSENLRESAPYIEDDLENAWYSLTGEMKEVPWTMDTAATPPELAQAQETRDKLISGANFGDLIANATNMITSEDIERINNSDFGALNGILPFEINVDSVGEDLAAVLNALDIGQVSAILESEIGYHLIQLLDDNGGHIRIGHMVFQVTPAGGVDEPVAEEPSDIQQAEDVDPLQQAINRLAEIAEREWR